MIKRILFNMNNALREIDVSDVIANNDLPDEFTKDGKKFKRISDRRFADISTGEQWILSLPKQEYEV